MNQHEAIEYLKEIYGYLLQDASKCTGITETCPVDECILCSVRDCPDNEPLHYHHDGCPSCYEKFPTE